MKRYTAATIPKDAVYLGSTEGADHISEAVADLINDAICPAYIIDQDNSRSFFELCPLD